MGPNYMDWKQNLHIIFTVEEYKYVLYNPCPVIGESSTDEKHKAEKRMEER
jgi:hypothetical protein